MFSAGEWDLFGFLDAVNKDLFGFKKAFSGHGRGMLWFGNICTEHRVTICFSREGKGFSEEKYLILISGRDCSFSSSASVILSLKLK